MNLLFAQTEEQLKDIKKAEQSFRSGDYAEALKIYLPLLETLDETAIAQHNINYNVGFCYYASAPEDSFAVSYFRKYLESSEVHFEAYYFLGNIASSNHLFDTAIFHYTKFKQYVENNEELSNSGLSEQIIEIADKLIAKCELAKFLVKYPNCAQVESITGGINSAYSEYAPVISPDETRLVFTKRSPETLGGRISDDGDFFEDIYISQISKTAMPLETDEYGNAIGDATYDVEMFSMPVNMGQNLNTEGHEGAVQFSSDGSKFYIYRKSNIWVSKKKKKQTIYDTKNWKKAKRQKQIKGVLRPKTYEPSVSISSDGNIIYFSSERPGGFGGLDIYKSELGSNGKWSEPINLGEAINTSADEEAPFISPDGNTLYFSSKGHTNMGDYDIFITEFNGETWSKPLNMGYPVNSANDDIFYVVSPLSGTGYLSSNRTGGLGLMDIYKANFPANAAPKAEISGTLQANDSLAAFVNISFTESESPENPIVIFTDSSTGEFSFPAKFGKTYFIKIDEKNFEPHSDTIAIPELIYFCQQFADTMKIFLNRIKPDTIPPVDSLALSTAADSIAKADSLAKEAEEQKKTEPEKKQAAKNLTDPVGLILYRVQIGAHANPLSKNIYENVPNLQVIPFEDGLTRYFSGAFSTYSEANNRKEEMIRDGFEGAFIVAFKNGQRIPLSDIKSIQKEKSSVNKTAMANDSKKNETKTNAEKNHVIKFKVQVGAYKNEVPADALAKFSNLVNMEKFKTPEGVMLYLSGEFSDFDSVQKHRNTLVEKGFPKAFVIGEINKKIITAQEAIELLKKKK